VVDNKRYDDDDADDDDDDDDDTVFQRLTVSDAAHAADVVADTSSVAGSTAGLRVTFARTRST